MITVLLITFLATTFSTTFMHATSPQPMTENNIMVITQPVADLRIKPQKALDVHGHDELQDSQLLFGEHIKCIKKEKGWLFVQALEQETDSDGTYHPMSGWIEEKNAQAVETFLQENASVCIPWAPLYEDDCCTKVHSHLSIGTNVKVIIIRNAPSHDFYDAFVYVESNMPHYFSGKEYELAGIRMGDGSLRYIKANCLHFFHKNASEQIERKKIIECAQLCIGMPYRWGGRCAYDPHLQNIRTSFDCSGLSNICYRVIGKNIPRDSGPQMRKSTSLKNGSLLKAGDLIFLARENNPQKIVHVMIYATHDSIIEARGEDIQMIRKITGKELFGKPIEEIKNGEISGEYCIYFGTYFS